MEMEIENQEGVWLEVEEQEIECKEAEEANWLVQIIQ
jgi:hypothetical protein